MEQRYNPKSVVYLDGGRLPMTKSVSKTMKRGAWMAWLFTKYTFQTYGALMLTLFGFYYYEYVDLNDDLLMVSHVCLLGSFICAALLVMHRILEDE